MKNQKPQTLYVKFQNLDKDTIYILELLFQRNKIAGFHIPFEEGEE